MPHVTFIHGMCNKPAADLLLQSWLSSLADGGGLDLGAAGVTSSMVYWADVVYADPITADESPAASAAGASPETKPIWRDALGPEEKAFVTRLAAKFGVDRPVEPLPSEPQPMASRVPLPWVVKRPLMESLLRDVHHYLFNAEYSPRPGTTYRVRDEIRRRTVTTLQDGMRGSGPHVIVSHSMGTLIAYDCLKRVAGVPGVDALMTIGSPLGLDEIQDCLRPEWSRDNGFPGERLSGRWVNVFDQLDPVAGFDPHLANDYCRGGAQVIEDLSESNDGVWRHDIAKYLAGPELRRRLLSLLAL